MVSCLKIGIRNEIEGAYDISVLAYIHAGQSFVKL